MARNQIDPQQIAVITELSRQVATLTGQVEALTTMKDRTAELNNVTAQVEDAKLSLKRVQEEHKIAVARIREENDREKRETLHDVGLLRKQLTQDTENQKKQAEMAQQAAVLQVREENLSADKTRFADEMQFQRQQMMNEMTGLKEIVGQLMVRLPVINVELESPAALSRGAHAKES